MFVRTLQVHWKALRWPLAIMTVASFMAPLLWVGPTAAALAGLPEDQAARFWIRGTLMTDADLIFPLLAMATGILMALGVWYRDHAGDHALALSLPVTRTRYVLVKFGAGLVLIVPVIVAFYIGAVVASAGLQLPDWLHAQPGRLAFRVLLATSVMYALTFAFAAGTIPTTLKVVTAFAILAVILPLLPVFIGPAAGEWLLRVSEVFYHIVYESVGPFAVLFGDWSLLGV